MENLPLLEEKSPVIVEEQIVNEILERDEPPSPISEPDSPKIFIEKTKKRRKKPKKARFGDADQAEQAREQAQAEQAQAEMPAPVVHALAENKGNRKFTKSKNIVNEISSESSGDDDDIQLEKVVVPEKKPKRKATAKQLAALEIARAKRAEKASVKRRTPKINPPPPPPENIRETFNTHLLPSAEEKQKQKHQEDFLQFNTFLDHMETYKRIKNNIIDEEYKKKGRAQVQAKQRQTLNRPAAPHTVGNAAPAAAAPPPKTNAYTNYFT
jgi:hypothetical protein